MIFSFVGFFLRAQEKPEGLFINSKAPDFELKDQNGKLVSLKDIRKRGPVVIVFYRGYWCPYCSRYLKNLEDSLQLVKEKGGELIAITAEKKEGVDKTIAKTDAAYSILTDEDLKTMRAYKVLYQVDEKTVGRYKMANIDLAANNGQKNDAVFLPVPAVYIIGKDGEIKYRYFEPDYKKRVPVKEILDNLVGLK
jgi:peroxiredoxin